MFWGEGTYVYTSDWAQMACHCLHSNSQKSAPCFLRIYWIHMSCILLACSIRTTVSTGQVSMYVRMYIRSMRVLIWTDHKLPSQATSSANSGSVTGSEASEDQWGWSSKGGSPRRCAGSEQLLDVKTLLPPWTIFSSTEGTFAPSLRFERHQISSSATNEWDMISPYNGDSLCRRPLINCNI